MILSELLTDAECNIIRMHTCIVDEIRLTADRPSIRSIDIDAVEMDNIILACGGSLFAAKRRGFDRHHRQIAAGMNRAILERHVATDHIDIALIDREPVTAERIPCACRDAYIAVILAHDALCCRRVHMACVLNLCAIEVDGRTHERYGLLLGSAKVHALTLEDEVVAARHRIGDRAVSIVAFTARDDVEPRLVRGILRLKGDAAVHCDTPAAHVNRARLERPRARERHLLVGCRRDRTRFISHLAECARRDADLTSDIHIRIRECHCPAEELRRCGRLDGESIGTQRICCGRRCCERGQVLRIERIDCHDLQTADPEPC